MYQEVGKPFADSTLFKVGKWVADFKFLLLYKNQKEVGEPNANFRLFIVDMGLADFNFYVAAVQNWVKLANRLSTSIL